jgi:hypothetical protein
MPLSEPMTPSSRLLWLVPVLTGLSACLTDETVTVRPVWAVVYGTVRSASGSPVSGALVAMRAEPEGACPATEHTNVNVATYEALSDNNGAFRAEVKNDIWPHVHTQDFCVHLVVSSPGSGFRDTALSVEPIHFSPTVTDSARADVVLSPL